MRKLALALLMICHAAPAAAADVTVFASASLEEVVEMLAESFEDRTGEKVGITLAGRSALTRQSRRGPSTDIIISADIQWLDRLEDGKAIMAPSRRVIAGNRLVLVARSDDADAAATIEAALSEGGRGMIAIADPSNAPGGQRAREALRELGLWDTLKARTAQAGDTREVIRFVQRRVARYGIAYHTDALAFEDIKEVAVFAEDLHDPIRYELALTFQGQALNRELSSRFVEHVLSPAGFEILAAAGFIPCPDGC
jgi:molybdate transport system substrate-binding protein